MEQCVDSAVRTLRSVCLSALLYDHDHSRSTGHTLDTWALHSHASVRLIVSEKLSFTGVDAEVLAPRIGGKTGSNYALASKRRRVFGQLRNT